MDLARLSHINTVGDNSTIILRRRSVYAILLQARYRDLFNLFELFDTLIKSQRGCKQTENQHCEDY